MSSELHAGAIRVGRILVAVALGVLVAVIVQVASFIYRLAWFWPLPWILGALGVGAFSHRLLSTDRRSIVFLLLPIGAYTATIAATERHWFRQRSLHTFRMTWEDLGSRDASGQTEIRLRFVDRPDHFVGIHSNEVARRLSSVGRDTVNVVFRVTRDLGCLRGYHEVDIDGWRPPAGARAYGGRSGAGPPGSGPWGEDPPWCR